MIVKTPGICGGNARIEHTRITVWSIISFMQQGATNTWILTNFPSLTQVDVNDAWAYYLLHRSEIDSVIDDG